MLIVVIVLCFICSIDCFYYPTYIKKHIASSPSLLSSTSSSENDETSSKLFILMKDFVKNERIASFISKDELISVLEEIKANDELWQENKIVYDKYWLKLEEQLRNENRRIDEILGSSLTSKILKTVQDIDVYDPVAVRTFLQTPAVELMISGILYEGIFEFLQRVDIIGNVVNQLPIIGPIRQSIVKEFKQQLDKVLAPQVKTFLSTFNRIAVERMISFVLSNENRKGFAAANVKLIENILSRKISTLVPNKDTSNKLKDQAWSAIIEVPINDLTPSLDIIYEQLGDKSISSFIDVDKVLDSSKTAKIVFVKNINKFITSELGKEAINIVK